MKTQAIKKHWLIGFILLLSLGLRFYKYYEFPVAGETKDEVAWSMLGASLLQTGKPASWSWFAAYDQYVVGYINEQNQKINLSAKNKNNNQQYDFRLVSPVFDHPPLFSLLPGFFHTLKNNWASIPSIKLVRLPLAILGTLNVWLLYLVAQKIFAKNKLVYLATVLYGFIPTFVFSSRLVVAENLLVTWMLVAIYLIKSKIKKKHIWLLVVSIAAILTKVSGIVIPLGLVAYGLSQKRDQTLAPGLGGLLIGEVLFFIYGGLYNMKLFLEVNFAQSNRRLGLATFINRYFLHPAVVEKIFFDGWLILGFIAALLWFTHQQKQALLPKIYFILWILFIAATSGEQTFHAWYDYPLYPLIALSLAWFLHYLYQKRAYWLAWLSWILVLPTLRLALRETVQYQALSNMTLRVLMGVGALPLGFSMLERKKLARYALLGLGVILLIASMWSVIQLTNRVYWEMDLFFK